MTLQLVPVTLKAANRFIAEHHRHLKPARGCVCAVGVERAGALVGVLLVGRPVAHRLQDGRTAEVTRCATDGSPNACSMLYGAARRAVRALGYSRLVTYTLPDEGGASLRAAGFTLTAHTRGGVWSRAGRPRADEHPTEPKARWSA